jgi:hypothetical protein
LANVEMTGEPRAAWRNATMSAAEVNAGRKEGRNGLAGVM